MYRFKRSSYNTSDFSTISIGEVQSPRLASTDQSEGWKWRVMSLAPPRILNLVRRYRVK